MNVIVVKASDNQSINFLEVEHYRKAVRQKNKEIKAEEQLFEKWATLVGPVIWNHSKYSDKNHMEVLGRLEVLGKIKKSQGWQYCYYSNPMSAEQNGFYVSCSCCGLGSQAYEGDVEWSPLVPSLIEKKLIQHFSAL